MTTSLFVINLAIVSATIFLLRRLDSLAENNTEDESNTCRCNFLGFSLDLHKIPFVTETFLCIETIKESVHGYKIGKSSKNTWGSLRTQPMKTRPIRSGSRFAPHQRISARQNGE